MQSAKQLGTKVSKYMRCRIAAELFSWYTLLMERLLNWVHLFICKIEFFQEHIYFKLYA